jgi:hypothetical protein
MFAKSSGPQGPSSTRNPAGRSGISPGGQGSAHRASALPDLPIGEARTRTPPLPSRLLARRPTHTEQHHSTEIAVPVEVCDRLSDEVFDALLAGARAEQETVGPDGSLGDLTRRLVERAIDAS